jgi:Mrp family chromosome partitioning ATPase
VLLIEADRAPYSDRRPRFGLVDVLACGADLPRAFVEHSGGGYTLLPFGGRTIDKRASTSALMSGVTLRAALRLCRRWFDIVVIDGPPVLDSGQARLLARQADLTAFVVEWDKTSPANVKEALNRLDAEDVTFVLNKVDIERYRLFEPAQSVRLAAKAEVLSRAA